MNDGDWAKLWGIINPRTLATRYGELRHIYEVSDDEGACLVHLSKLTNTSLKHESPTHRSGWMDVWLCPLNRAVAHATQA